jgi:aspartate/methionine/tyrosine aminotransferase
MIRRDYTTISCGMIDDLLASLGLEHKDKILERNLGIVRNNAAVLDRWVQSESSISYVKPRAGTTAFLHYDHDIPSREFCRRLVEMNGTLLVPGECFDMENYLRIGYAFDPEVLTRGLEGISDLLRELEKEGV